MGRVLVQIQRGRQHVTQPRVARSLACSPMPVVNRRRRHKTSLSDQTFDLLASHFAVFSSAGNFRWEWCLLVTWIRPLKNLPRFASTPDFARLRRRARRRGNSPCEQTIDPTATFQKTENAIAGVCDVPSADIVVGKSCPRSPSYKLRS